MISIFAKEENSGKKLVVAELEFMPRSAIVSNAPTPALRLVTPNQIPKVVSSTEVPTSMPTVANFRSDLTLLTVVNSFRNANGVSPLNISESLCKIAEKRLTELITKGSLDSHVGFNKFFSSQTEFSAMGEVIFQSSSKQPAEYAVNEGWAKSTAGHRGNLLDSRWNFGCGTTNGYFSVFNLGKK